MPISALIRPRIISLPVSITTSDSENSASAQYSKGPNAIATFASIGAISIIRSNPKMVPRNEKKMPTPSAFGASPLSAIGRPSKQVATEAGVPGIFRRIAEISPPLVPPIYRPIRSAIPAIGLIV